MSWSKTEPELPSNSVWEQEKSISGTANHWKLTGKLYIARLNGKQFAVKAVLTSANGSYGDYYPPSNWKLRCDIGDVTGTEDTSFGISKGTTTFYFVGEAEKGVTITVKVGGVSGAVAVQTVTFTAPALIGNLCFVKVNGAWVKGQMKLRTGGVWSDVFAKIKAGGIWK